MFPLERGQFAFLDSGHARLDGTQRLRGAMTVQPDRVPWDKRGLAASD